MYQNQETTYFLESKPYLLNRLYLGSVGGEFWSCAMLMFHPASILYTTVVGAQFTQLIAMYAPIAFSLLLAIGIAHFILLLLPTTRNTIIQRKLYSIIGCSYWAYLAYVALSLPTPLFGVAAGLSPMIILLFFSLLRREY